LLGGYQGGGETEDEVPFSLLSRKEREREERKKRGRVYFKSPFRGKNSEGFVICCPSAYHTDGEGKKGEGKGGKNAMGLQKRKGELAGKQQWEGGGRGLLRNPSLTYLGGGGKKKKRKRPSARKKRSVLTYIFNSEVLRAQMQENWREEREGERGREKGRRAEKGGVPKFPMVKNRKSGGGGKRPRAVRRLTLLSLCTKPVIRGRERGGEKRGKKKGRRGHEGGREVFCLLYILSET